MSNIETDFEFDLRMELEKLEQIFNNEIMLDEVMSSSPAIPRNHNILHKIDHNNKRSSISMFEIAEAEGEREELEGNFLIMSSLY